VRDAIVARLAVLGVAPRLRAVPGDGIAASGPPAVLVVAAQEDRVIATEVRRSLSA
jgi:hypothetical protein